MNETEMNVKMVALVESKCDGGPICKKFCVAQILLGLILQWVEEEPPQTPPILCPGILI